MYSRLAFSCFCLPSALTKGVYYPSGSRLVLNASTPQPPVFASYCWDYLFVQSYPPPPACLSYSEANPGAAAQRSSLPGIVKAWTKPQHQKGKKPTKSLDPKSVLPSLLLSQPNFPEPVCAGCLPFFLTSHLLLNPLPSASSPTCPQNSSCCGPSGLYLIRPPSHRNQHALASLAALSAAATPWASSSL